MEGENPTRQTYHQYLLTPEELNNPTAWLQKAQRFRSAVLLILEEYRLRIVDGAKLDEIALIIDAINIVPYLTCLGLELYMKGYLVSIGLTGKEAREYQHRIWEIREKCYEKSKKTDFNNPALKYFTDQTGPHILDDGGVRYPHKRDLSIFISCSKESLDLMHNILKDKLKNN